jgi:hypothetical protein
LKPPQKSAKDYQPPMAADNFKANNNEQLPNERGPPTGIPMGCFRSLNSISSAAIGG